MYTHFEALDGEKRERIQNAAMREFARFGYEKTSTEQIARAAGISKGMLFHYFGNKLGLFEYLTDESGKMITELTEGMLRRIEGMDYLDQYRDITRRKLEYTLHYPEQIEFMSMLYTYPEHARVSERVARWYEETRILYRETMEWMANSATTAPFRKDLGREKSLRYIDFMMEGFTQYVTSTLKAAPSEDLGHSPLWDQFYEMLEDIRVLFYEEEGEEA